jgi:hypothetical protein
MLDLIKETLKLLNNYEVFTVFFTHEQMSLSRYY